MSLDIAFLSKIIGGILAASTASYGGWVAYDVNNPTFHRLITESGFVWSPIDGDMKISESWGSDRATASSKMGGDWRCTKQLFNGLTIPSTDTANADKGNAKSGSGSEQYEGHDTPNKTTVNEDDWKDDKPVGCLVADLGYSPDGKRNGFIKWELALRSGSRGFIYVGYMSFGATKETGDGRTGTSTYTQISFSLAFEVSKQSNTWKIGKGFTWSDMLINGINSNDANAKVTVLLPNEHKWETKEGECKDNCSALEEWNFYKWVGFWEPKEGGDKQPTDALDIQMGEPKTDQSNKHDVWKAPDFDFKTSNQTTSNQTAWSSGINQWYDDKERKWKEAKGATGDKGYLEEIYKPWAKKKGEWKEASQVCYQSNSRHIGEEESKRLLNFCYQKQGSELTA